MLHSIHVKLLAGVVYCIAAGVAGLGTRKVQLSYLGCFKDFTNGVRDMTPTKPYNVARIGSQSVASYEFAILSSLMTLELCAALCSMTGTRYFGVQAAAWCFCSDSYGSQGSAYESLCNEGCGGDPSKICGGQNANSVYQLNYQDQFIFYLGNRTYAAMNNASAPAYNTISTNRSRIECMSLCQHPTCPAVLYSKQGLCHLLDFPALPFSLANQSFGEFYVRG